MTASSEKPKLRHVLEPRPDRRLEGQVRKHTAPSLLLQLVPAAGTTLALPVSTANTKEQRRRGWGFQTSRKLPGGGKDCP